MDFLIKVQFNIGLTLFLSEVKRQVFLSGKRKNKGRSIGRHRIVCLEKDWLQMRHDFP